MKNRLPHPIVFHKGNERYVFLYDSRSTLALLQTLSRFASRPDLSFDQYDSAALSRVVRRESAVLG